MISKQSSKWRKRGLRIALLLAAIYAIALTVVLIGQRHLLYFPSRFPLELAIRMGSRSGFTPWEDASGDVVGWERVGQTNLARDRILITHGNGGSALDRAWLAESLDLTPSFDVYILEYPGYGARSGSPSQRNLCAAADQAFGLLSK